MQRAARRYEVVTGKAYRPRIVLLGALGLGGVGLPRRLPSARQARCRSLVLVWASFLPFLQLPTAEAFGFAVARQLRRRCPGS